MKTKTFLELYDECVESDVVGPPAESNGSDQFSKDFYAPGDSRIPKTVMPMLTRFGVVGTKTKKKKKKLSTKS